MTSDIDIASLLDDEKKPVPPAETELSDRDPLWTWEHLIVLVAITVLAGVLRLYKIGEWSFWVDEVHTLRDAILNTPEQFWSSPTSRYPIGFALLRYIQPWLPGSGEGSWRLLFAFFGICSVPMLAVLVRRMLGVAPALLAAAFLALSPWHLYWSQNCRFYTIVLFFALAAMGAFYIGVEKGSGIWLFGSVVLGALSALSHPSAASIFVAFLAYILLLLLLRTHIEWPKRLTKKTLTYAFLLPLAIGAVGLFIVVLQAFQKFRSVKPDISIFHLANTMVFFVRVPIILGALGGMVLLWRRSRRACLFLSTMLLVPSLAVGASSLLVKATAQYLFFTLPLWCALSAYGAVEILSSANLRGIAMYGARLFILGIIVLDLVTQDHLYFHYRHGDRPKWREAAAFVEKNGAPEDIVATTNERSMEWYLNPLRPFAPIRTPSGEERDVVHELQSWSHPMLEVWRKSADEKGHRVWVVLEEPTLHLNDPSKKWDRWLRDNFHQVKRLPNWTGPKDMTILIYRYDPQVVDK